MMKVTDHTLGVIFGIIRGIFVMGVVYWGALWYFSDAPQMPDWIANARTRPVMQLTAVKLDKWFVPGAENKLLARDVAGTQQAAEIYNNLINPAVSGDVPAGSVKTSGPDAKPTPDAQNNKTDSAPAAKPAPETGYKSSERTALENQLLQIESAARAEKGNADTE